MTRTSPGLEILVHGLGRTSCIHHDCPGISKIIAFVALSTQSIPVRSFVCTLYIPPILGVIVKSLLVARRSCVDYCQVACFLNFFLLDDRRSSQRICARFLGRIDFLQYRLRNDQLLREHGREKAKGENCVTNKHHVCLVLEEWSSSSL